MNEFIENGDPYDVCIVVMCSLMNLFKDAGIPPDFDFIKDACLKIIEEDERSTMKYKCECESFNMLKNYKCYYCTYVKPYE